MKTATDRQAETKAGVVSIHRARHGQWLNRPSFSTLAGPWLSQPWRRAQVHRMHPHAAAFRVHLEGLDAAWVWARLHELAGGAEPILVNDAEPSLPNTMQRRMVAEWLGREVGEDIPELVGPTPTLHRVLGFDPWQEEA